MLNDFGYPACPPSTDFFDTMAPTWSTAMAKQYNSDQENFKETYMDKVKFKVGDRVIEKVSNRTSGIKDDGTITNKHKSIPNAWWVRWFDNTVAWTEEKDIELIEDKRLVNPTTGESKPLPLTNTCVEIPIDNNPKTLVALSKPRLSDVPPVALFALGAAMSDGASKYGRYNYRDTSATASIFYDAIVRHLADWYNGEDYADDSKVHHLGHIMASCAILMDSELHGTFKDDRDKRKSTSISRNKTWIKND
jgi:hypothetical protein